MVQRTHLKPERNQLQQQDTRGKGGGGGDPMKRLKKMSMRPTKDSNFAGPEPSASICKHTHKELSDGLPNYMKPTSSWDARKEKSQVTIHSSPVKILSRKHNLKRAKSLMKKSQQQNKVVNRNTCSSTLKDSKFPKALELSPGGTEAEGVSAVRVCPYNYCSLNGHCHAPLPPLKAFMSGRRKLLQTQKSFKLKGFPSFRAKGPGKDEKEIDTGQACISRTASGLAIIPLIEEISSDFFVEIYAKPQEEGVQLDNCDASNIQKEDGADNPRVVDALSLIQDGEDCAESEVEGEIGKIGLDIDLKSDYSDEEMDVMVNIMEYVEYGQQIEAEEENHPSLVPEDLCFECYVFDVMGKDSEGIGEGETIISTSGATDIDWEEEEGSFPDNETDYSEYSDDVLGSILHPFAEKETIVHEFSLEPSSNVCEIDDADVEQLLKADEENSNGVGSHDGQERSGIDVLFSCDAETSCVADILLQNQPTLAPETSEETEQGDGLIEEETEPLSREQNIPDSSLLCREEEVSGDQVKSSETEDVSPEGGKGDNDFCEDEGFETTDQETKQSLDDESLDHPILSNGNTLEDDEVEGTGSLFTIQLSESCQCSAETEKDMTEGGHIQTEQGAEECKWDEVIKDPSVDSEFLNTSIAQSDDSNGEKLAKVREEGSDMEGSISRATKHVSLEINEVTEIKDGVNSDTDGIFLLTNNESSEEEETINIIMANSGQSLTEAADKPKARIVIIRKRTAEEPEKMKEFNPRSPRFLPFEPEPEAEKVNLRHVMMVERENAEEWMVDYALQQADTDEVTEIEADDDHVNSDTDDIFLLISDESSEEDKTVNTAMANSTQSLTEAADKMIARIRIIRKATTEETEQMKEFNPRSPRFLPIEPEPEAEKVDLRHLLMDERKNAEEWMVDYALQRAVSKLAPARKKKVALLVEAFETVAPLPIREEPLRHATSGFAHAWPMQACN